MERRFHQVADQQIIKRNIGTSLYAINVALPIVLTPSILYRGIPEITPISGDFEAGSRFGAF